MTTKIQTAGGATANADTFTWSNQYGGSWGTAANWVDVTSPTAVAAAPGATNTVSITGGIASFTNITGTGSVAQLTVNNDVLLWGKATSGGSITVAATSPYAGSDLELDGGAVLAGASLNVQANSTLEVGDSSRLTISGSTALAGGFLSASNGSIIQLGGLIPNSGPANGAYLYGSLANTLMVDGNSSIEIGTTGSAALGAITIDKSQSIAFEGAMNGNVVVNGTIGIQAGGALSIGIAASANVSTQAPALSSAAVPSLSTVTGSGLIRLSEGSTLTLGGTDSAAVQFSAPSGVLMLNSYVQTGTISGFAATDMIKTAVGLATGLSVSDTSSAATLTFSNGGKTVGTLTLAGNYTSNLFHFSRTISGSGIVTLQTVGSAPVVPSLILGTAGYDVLTATANNQTLTGLGGNDSLAAGAFTGIDFKDTSADLNGSAIQSFGTTDVIDLTDMSLAKAVVNYTPSSFALMPYFATLPASLLITDGTHSANIALNALGALPVGYFAASTDGGTGTDIKYVSVNTDAYSLAAPLGGSYSSAGNWKDTTISATAISAPGAGTNVTIAGASTGYTSITGNGTAASLTTSGDVLIWGSITVSSLLNSVNGSLIQSGTLTLDGGASLILPGSGSTGAGAMIGGTVEVGGSSKLTGASLTFTQSGAALQVTGGSTAQFAALGAASTTNFVYVPPAGSATIAVDATSSLEIGVTGNAAKGALTIDAGVTASLSGAVEGNVVLNGTLAMTGSTLSVGGFGTATGSITGNGTLVFGTFGGPSLSAFAETLQLSGSDTAAIHFAGSDDLLSLGSIMPTGTISGFTAGDAISVAQAVTGITYSPGAGVGTLTLLDGIVNVGTLVLAGSYGASQFQVQVAPNGQSSTLVYLPAPNTSQGNQVSVTNHAFSWTATGGGDWTNSNDWFDTTAQTASKTAPGIADAVSVTVSAAQIISGNGSAAALTITSNSPVIFTGTVAVAGLLYTQAYQGYLELTNGAKFNAGTLSQSGLMELNGGSALTVTGTVASNLYGATEVLGGSSFKVNAGGFLSGILTVDGSSTAELGAVGNAAVGAVTIDAGATAICNNSTIAANMVINGSLGVTNTLIEGFGGTTGTITGSGEIDLTYQTFLTLDSADSVAIVFQPMISSGTLELGGPLPTGTISGFAASDIIQVDQTVTGLKFVQTTPMQGTLTLLDGAATVGTLKLAGSYTGELFHVDVAAPTGVATITVQTLATTGTNSTVSSGHDAYNWVGTGVGGWGTAANWLDTTTNATPATAPGSSNAVTITGTGALVTVGGNGAAASLTTGGGVLLTGQVNVAGSLMVGTQPGLSAALELDSAAKLAAASATIVGELEVGGGSTATITGMAMVSAGAVLSLDGSTVQLGSLVGNNDVISVDANSSIAIGTVVSPALGTLTQGSGSTVALTGAIYGNVTANGIMSVAGGGALFIDMNGSAEYDPYETSPGITGNGTLSVGEGGTLGLGVADSVAIQFAGPNATLMLAKLPTANITGFAAGDQIQVDMPVSSLSFTQTTLTSATLTLSNGTATVGTLKLAGNYSASSSAFHLEASGAGTTATITLQSIGVAALQPTLIQGTAAVDLLSATANGQTLTGLGGGDTLNGGSFTAVDFKDLTANLNASVIQHFATSDILDFTDMTSSLAKATFSAGVLSVGDGTHSASITLGSISATGGFHVSSDGGAGTKLLWS